jgi:competence protein ComEC
MISITASQLDEPEYPFEKLFIRDILIDGRIEEIELPSDKLTLKVSVERTFKNDTTVTEKYNVLCNLNYDEETIEQILNRLRPGNRVVMLGNLQIPPNQRNPGEFDYREYLRGNDIAVVFTSFNPMDFVIVDYNEDFISSFVFGVRYAVAKQIKKIYTDKTAGLLKGLLLADRSEIGYDIKEGFINSGVIHVLAVSGLHVGFIVLILA